MICLYGFVIYNLSDEVQIEYMHNIWQHCAPNCLNQLMIVTYLTLRHWAEVVRVRFEWNCFAHKRTQPTRIQLFGTSLTLIHPTPTRRRRASASVNSHSRLTTQRNSDRSYLLTYMLFNQTTRVALELIRFDFDWCETHDQRHTQQPNTHKYKPNKNHSARARLYTLVLFDCVIIRNITFKNIQNNI